MVVTGVCQRTDKSGTEQLGYLVVTSVLHRFSDLILTGFQQVTEFQDFHINIRNCAIRKDDPEGATNVNLILNIQ
jgi:hypothetical protein